MNVTIKNVGGYQPALGRLNYDPTLEETVERIADGNARITQRKYLAAFADVAVAVAVSRL